MIELVRQTSSKTILRLKAPTLPNILLVFKDTHHKPKLVKKNGTAFFDHTTKATVVIGDREARLGVARCSKSDRYSRSEGWQRALDRALNPKGEKGEKLPSPFSKVERERIWGSLWSVFPPPQRGGARRVVVQGEVVDTLRKALIRDVVDAERSAKGLTAPQAYAKEVPRG